METATIKAAIKKTYGDIAKGEITVGCCTDSACCGGSNLNTMTGDYSGIEGYEKEADLALGCGLPTELAAIKEGDTVVDLGSGAGNDVFIARRIVGATGKVIGIDMTPEMVIRALQNNQKLGYKNVSFELGEIEEMNTIPTDTADVVISNCVMNLVQNKVAAFNEVFRILKTGGHFSIADIVYSGYLPDRILEAAELYAGCVAGATEKGNYLGIIKSAGFKNIQVKSERLIQLPDDLLLKFIDQLELDRFRKSDSGIYSITIYADKLEDGACCTTTDSGCCGSEIAAAHETADCCGKEHAQGNSGCCG